jgi:ATP-binding cassette subfamily A (ABC1) protein 3
VFSAAVGRFVCCSGKSTLVNCLTGLLSPTFGNGWIFGHSLTNIHRLQQEMGVCMQDDLLFEELTTRETLRVFAAMRGILQQDVERTVNAKLREFHMDSYADKIVKALSGGMKRRLSLSLATLGNPRIIFLDEVKFKNFNLSLT